MPRTSGLDRLGRAPRHEEFESLLVSLEADACLIGLFSSQCMLAARPWVVLHNMRAGDLSEDAIYALLFGGSFSGFHSVIVDHLLDRDAFLRGVVLKRVAPGFVFEARVAQQLLEALRLAIRPDRALALLRPSAGRVAVERRQSAQLGVVMLDANLSIRERWLAREDAPFGPMTSRLPVYIEEPLRMQLRDWDWRRSTLCEPIAFTPVPDILVRAYPMERDGAVRAMVALERVQVRVALDRARREHHLSARETEVLGYLFEGYRVEEIAQALSVAESTVQDHIKRAIAKAGVRNRIQLAARILGWELATSQP